MAGAHAAMGGQGQQRLPEGSATETIYGLIRDGKHAECIKFLEVELASAPHSRPALSLLGYCYYYVGNFDAAASMYDQLSRLFPEAGGGKLDDFFTTGRQELVSYHANTHPRSGAQRARRSFPFSLVRRRSHHPRRPHCPCVLSLLSACFFPFPLRGKKNPDVR